MANTLALRAYYDTGSGAAWTDLAGGTRLRSAAAD